MLYAGVPKKMAELSSSPADSWGELPMQGIHTAILRAANPDES